MAIYHNEIIDIPPKAFFHKRKDIRYVYIYTKFYRNSDGMARNHSLCIGKKISDTKMNPNDNYYCYFNIEKESNDTEVVKVGYSMIVERCFKETGLNKILSNNFGIDICNDIKVIASYLVQGGSSMSYVDDYMKEHCFSNRSQIITSQRISEIFENIMNKDLNNFFKQWIKKVAGKDYICYDITSVSTYSDWITHAEYGYNRDHEDLKQINIGLFTAESTKTPVYYENYNGSLTDKTNLINVIKNVKDKGIKKVKVVMDGGFFDKERLLELFNSGLTFTIGMPGNLKLSKEIISNNNSDLYTSKYSTNYKNTFGKLIDYELFGIKGKVFVGLDTNTRNLKLEDLNRKVAQYTDELNNSRKKYSTVIKEKKYTALFKINEKENSKGFTFELDESKIAEMSANYGYFLIFTTDMNATANNIIYHYREKDTDEKMFYALKNYNDLNRLRTHSQKTTDGKVFVSFISLILRSWLNEKIYEYKKISHLTLKKIILKLGDIQVLHNNNDVRYLKSVTKEQKKILDYFGLNTDDILNDSIEILR